MDSRNSRATVKSSPSRTKLRLRKSISISLLIALMTFLSYSVRMGRSFWMFCSESAERSVWNTVSSPSSCALLRLVQMTSSLFTSSTCGGMHACIAAPFHSLLLSSVSCAVQQNMQTDSRGSSSSCTCS